MTKLTRKKEQWTWGDEQRDAFSCIKNCLVSKPILGYPDFSRDFIIYTDASGYGIGAVLAQIQRPPHSSGNDREVVIAYSSKHLNDREAKWSTTEKEAYAIIHAINVFKPYLYGRKFTVITDHRPLEWLMSKKEPAGRLARWALKIQEYDINIGYRSGKTNQNADCLSRIPKPLIATITPKCSTDWSEAQRSDEYCKKIIDSLENNEAELIEKYQFSANHELLDKYHRLVVPQCKRNEIMELNHDHMLAGHLGIAKTIARIRKQFTWPNLKDDVTAYVNGCLTCARRKSYGASKAPLCPMPLVNRVWEKIAMDIVGPIQVSSNGNNHILVLSDYASRFVFTIPMKDTSARTVARHFVNKIITKYGAPEHVLTDQGTNFLSKLINEICQLFKIKQLKTTSYHPQTDGLVERFNRTLCDMLACYVNEEPEKWDQFLPFVTLAYNSAQQASVKQSPFYLFFGREAILPNEVTNTTRYRYTENDGKIYAQRWQQAFDFAKTHLQEAQSKQKSYYDEKSKINKYEIDDLVLLRLPESTGKFNNKWEGPFRVNKVLSDLTYEIIRLNITSNRQLNKQTVHSNRIKRYLPRTTNVSEPIQPINPHIIEKHKNKVKPLAKIRPRPYGKPDSKYKQKQPKIVKFRTSEDDQVEKVVKRRGRPPKIQRPILKQNMPLARDYTVPFESMPYRVLRSHNNNLVTTNRASSSEPELQASTNQPAQPVPRKHRTAKPIRPHVTNRYNLRSAAPQLKRL